MALRKCFVVSLLTTVGVAGTVAIGAPGAVADDAVVEGGPCPSSELGNSATTGNGTAVRCLATEDGGFSWAADTGASSTIADLQKQGFTVRIDRVGSGPLSSCKVTEVRNPVTISQTMSDPPGPHTPLPMTTIVISKTISVSLDCTG